MPKIWGLGKHASADGTKWDLHTQNLISEYHLRYGGYGGIGYYMVSDMYIALFSQFTTCGSWEGHNILDYLVENDSDVLPDTIHADTQGQSAAIFGLAHLLGIQLQPRIRNWKAMPLLDSLSIRVATSTQLEKDSSDRPGRRSREVAFCHFLR